LNPSPGSFYLDTCLLMSLFHNDAGYAAAAAWLATVDEGELWISHLVLLEFAFATAVRRRRGELLAGRVEAVRAALELFCRERLGMLEPRGDDFLLARGWLQGDASLGLGAAEALHRALAHPPQTHAHQC
jgi:hypothetical protein